MVKYLTVDDAGTQLGISGRTVRTLCEQYEWFGTRLGATATWVLLQDEIDRMKITSRPKQGRPRNPIAGVAAN